MDTDNLNAMVPHDIWHVAVLIPARNEEDLLPRCLESVAIARAMLPPGVTSDVIVISDSSTDRTVELARALLGPDGLVLDTEAGCVGVARALAATVALRRHTGPLNRCWLANTDADCEVPATWLVDQLQIARRGHAAVAGIVDVHDFSEHLPIVKERFRRTYQIGADGTHSHIHGANLGVRADRYLMAGGWSPLTTGEDHDLWRRLPADDGSQLSDAKLRVITSGRRLGRAPLGFAGALAAHDDAVAA
jgi:glycosyltransferase involved in cell wall biosynthesis